MIKTDEKTLIREIHKRAGSPLDGSWRDDGIIIESSPIIVYSLDHPERIGLSGPGVPEFRQYGRWSASLIANDIWAMGAHPEGISFDVGLKGWSERDLSDWLDGVMDICRHYGMSYEGGNINRISDSVAGMAWGKPARTLRRSGAQVGDRIVVTAAIGVGWALRLLADHKLPIPAPWEDYKLMPCVNPELFDEVFQRGYVHSAMDLTDGLYEFCWEISQRDGLGVLIQSPDSWSEPVLLASSHLGSPREAFLLELGYDTPYAHGWTVPEHQLGSVQDLFSRAGVPLSIVGRVTGPDSPRIELEFPTGNRIVAPQVWDDVLSERGSVDKWRRDVVEVLLQHQ